MNRKKKNDGLTTVDDIFETTFNEENDGTRNKRFSVDTNKEKNNHLRTRSANSISSGHSINYTRDKTIGKVTSLEEINTFKNLSMKPKMDKNKGVDVKTEGTELIQQHGIINIDHLTLPLDFHSRTDFYLPANNVEEGIIYPGAEGVKVHPEYTDILSKLLQIAKEKSQKRPEFSVNMIHNGNRVIFRGHSIVTLEGKVYIFRRLPSFIPKIHDLGMPTGIIKILTSKLLNSGGLVLISGETGNGKSTTAGATIAHRLHEFGSFCLTIEDPMELPLQGFYENDKGSRGVCFQTEVTEDTVEAAIKSSLRCYPAVSNSILFLGETRDSTMASEVLRIAANGHLVITTLHAMDIKNALIRFLSMANKNNTNLDETRNLMASVFRLVIHQKLNKRLDGKREIDAQILFSSKHSSSIASRIKEGKIDLLSTDIQSQNALIEQGIFNLDGI